MDSDPGLYCPFRDPNLKFWVEAVTQLKEYVGPFNIHK